MKKNYRHIYFLLNEYLDSKNNFLNKIFLKTTTIELISIQIYKKKKNSGYTPRYTVLKKEINKKFF